MPHNSANDSQQRSTPATPNRALYIGLMSGTSLDGVDGALASFADAGAASDGSHASAPGVMQTLATSFIAFPAELRRDLLALQQPGFNEIEREALAANALVQLYAQCVARLLEKAGLPSTAVRAIGVHGQTIRHVPVLGYTRQTNNPALLAELSGIDVVADLRSRDIAAGGQGAPLVPAFHHWLFGADKDMRVVLNLGGIANITLLEDQVRGFDTGPANVLMDGWIARHHDCDYDTDGVWAANGKADAGLLEHLRSEAYFRLPAPKSTGRDLFNADWLDARLKGFEHLAAVDVQATLAAFSASTIAEAIHGCAADAVAVYACGGGAQNKELMRLLQLSLATIGSTARVDSTAALGVAPNHVEALAFAWLAQRFCTRQPGNLPDVTGARGQRLLGALYPA
ncbi:MAG: anhydro-N-acetylmuramic acid kinase [Janthinobacterium lividum]